MAEKIAVVATEILRQLGGHRFLAMTGAKVMSFESLDEKRKWPGLLVFFPIGKIPKVRIALAPSDTYTLQFISRSGKIMNELDDIYVDVLQRVITDHTGLVLSL
jgi:hypothetical protein